MASAHQCLRLPTLIGISVALLFCQTEVRSSEEINLDGEWSTEEPETFEAYPVSSGRLSIAGNSALWRPLYVIAPKDWRCTSLRQYSGRVEHLADWRIALTLDFSLCKRTTTLTCSVKEDGQMLCLWPEGKASRLRLVHASKQK